MSEPVVLHHGREASGHPSLGRAAPGALRRSAGGGECRAEPGTPTVMERSGNKKWVHWRYSCSKFVRLTFVEWAGQTIPRSFWAKAFYEEARRSERHLILRAVQPRGVS